MSTEKSTGEKLLQFIDASPTPWHATRNLLERLLEAGYERLREDERWQLQPGGRYVLTRNDSSLLAFQYGRQALEENGIRMVGAHTDSPCLKLKPGADILGNGLHSLGVEVYGGALLNPWFDRDLSLAGRVHYRCADKLLTGLVNFERPLAVIPSLAIHLDREANKERSVNPQTDIRPALQLLTSDSSKSIRELLAAQLAADSSVAVSAIEVLDFEILCYDTQPAACTGLNGEFVSAARLDNLLSCFVGLESLLSAPEDNHCLLICTDHEEVGSVSSAGADGNLLLGFLHRLLPDVEQQGRCMSRSLLISADNAHAVHPNFPDRHDPQHRPLLGGGPVLKVNANQRYASNSESLALLRMVAADCGVTLQQFVARTDMGCGSTVGPMTAARTGVLTADIGVPTLGMHSCREMAAGDDVQALENLLSALFSRPGAARPGQH